jgi:hypothetical protein
LLLRALAATHPGATQSAAEQLRVSRALATPRARDVKRAQQGGQAWQADE